MFSRQRSPAVGPISGYTTAEFSRIWIKGEPAFITVIRWRNHNPDASETLWQQHSLPVIASLDYISVLDIPFSCDSHRLEIESTLVSDPTLVSSDSIWQSERRKATAIIQRAPDKDSPVSFIFGSCNHRGYGPFNRGDKSFKTLVAQGQLESSDFILMAGDQVYCDHPKNNGSTSDCVGKFQRFTPLG